jgi:thiamine-monophosphate kinase
MKKLKDIGEFGWIGIAERLCRPGGAVKQGIGDDAAVLAWNGHKDLLVTTDMILEGRHFRLNEASAFEIGHKAMAVNLSDIAAMGGVPTAAVISLGVPPGTSVPFLKQVYRGLLSGARRYGARIIGGDTNASARWVLAVTLLGEVEKGRAVLRSGARRGDAVLVTGSLGGSYASKKHLRFTPRVREARWLANHFRIHAMMDLSDGLASDIRRLCQRSRVGVELDLDALPLSRSARSVEQALSEGEDFELLFTMGAPDARRLLRARKPKGFPKITRIGRIVPEREGVGLPKLARGFDHFR